MSKARLPGQHGYICECSKPSCRERVYLAPSDYERISHDGVILHYRCAIDSGREIFYYLGAAAVVRTSWERLGKPG